MSWQNILKASEDKFSLPPEKIKRNVKKNTKDKNKDYAGGTSYIATEVKPLVSRDNKLTYFLASYLDDAQTLKELISEWKESQKMLEYKNAPLRLESISKGINILKKYFENIIPIETNRKSESDEQKTERLVEFFSKLPNPPTASDITTMENNLDILTKFTEKTKLTSKQKDKNRIDKVLDSIIDRDVDIDDVDVSNFNAEDLNTLVEYITDNRNRGRMKRLRPNKMKKVKEIINEIESKDKDFIGIGYETNGAILTLPATFDERSKSSLSDFNFENEGEVKKVKLPLFITEQQGKDLAGGSLEEELTITPLGQVFGIDEYSDVELAVSDYISINKGSITNEIIVKYFDLMLNNPKSSKGFKTNRDKFLPYMNPSQKEEASIIFGIEKGNTSRFNTSLRYFIENLGLPLGNISTTKETTRSFDKVLLELANNKHDGTALQREFNRQLKTKDSKAPKQIIPRQKDSRGLPKRDFSTQEREIVEEDEKGEKTVRTISPLTSKTGVSMKGMSKFLDTVKKDNRLYNELVKLAEMSENIPTKTTSTSNEVEKFVKNFREEYEKIENRRQKRRYLLTEVDKFKEIEEIKNLNLDDEKLEDLLKEGDISQINSSSVQDANKIKIFRESFKEGGKLFDINLPNLEEAIKSFDVDLISIFSLLYYLSILYQDDDFTDEMFEYADDEGETIEDEKEQQERETRHKTFMGKIKSKYTEYRTKFLEDIKEKIEEVLTKPILIGTKDNPSPNEPSASLIDFGVTGTKEEVTT